jgi:lipopolysaccharide export system protein LptA
VIKKLLPFLLAAALSCPLASAQKFGDKPLTEDDLLKQIESLTPKTTGTAAPKATPASTPKSPDRLAQKAAPESAPKSLFDNEPVLDDKKPAAEKKEKSDEKKAKGPTEITALEATFDQKANVAVFLGSVIVKDPEFNVTCDKLTAHLKHDEKPTTAPPGTVGKTTPKPATPKPGEAGAPPKKSGGLEKALAESTSDKRVVITQDKTEADGSITHSIGLSDKANYDAITGDIVLTGMPDVTQGVNRCIATDPSTVMTLNRDGHMHAVGPHRTIIVDKGDADSK